MSTNKHGSAKRRVQAKRQQQKKTVRRRLSISLLSFLGLSTLLGFAFLLGGGAQQDHGAKKPTPKTTTVTLKPKEKEKYNRPSEAVVVAEEYPQDEEKVGFGLEDLIRKTQHSRPEKEPVTAVKGEKPLLVLIIDDVSQARQLQAIRRLPYRITPSIFPPSQINRHSNLLAKNLKHYLIHLPMESGSKKMNRFAKTLFVEDGPAKIRARVKEIRRLFPKACFVNNHTGSVFTSNYPAMAHLYGDLKREGFIFLDSRTTGRSVVPRVSKEYHSPYVARDVFIDNVQKRSAILAQLKRAVRIAQKRGYAIAIGHPHPATFDALRHAKSILAPVETVYFDDFYRSRFGK
ncbi:divergent polysaccharide deacetylase family protein [Nitratifractor sp.]